MTARPILCCLACLLMAGWPAASRAAPLSFNTALPVAEGEFVVREQFVLDRSGHDPSGSDRDRTAWSVISALGYGITPEWSVFAVLPYVDKSLEATEGGIRRERGAGGLGDMRLFARYTAYKRDLPGRTFRVAAFVGLEFPTGDDDAGDADGRLPRGVQPGSGSWDPFGGAVVTYQTLAYQIDAQIGHTGNTQADGFAFGDVTRLDLSVQYRLWPDKLGPGVPGFLYGILEGNLIHRGRNRNGGVDDPNSGGTSLLILPGLQYVTRRWIVEAGVQIPVVQDLNGTALENSYTVRAGFRVNF